MIELKGVSKAFGTQRVLNGISLQVNDGEKLCIIGKSGSGKSVLMKLMTGLLKVDAGEIWMEGQEVSRFSKEKWAGLLRNMGVVFQGAALFDSLSVLENVGIRLLEEKGAKMKEVEEKVSRALALVGLNPHEVLLKFPSELSGGMQKRVGIARAIVHEPKIVFYDEPTTGLDPVNSQVIDNLIESLTLNQGRTSIIITHDLHSVRQIASKVAMVHEGNLHFFGSPSSFFQSQDPVIRQYLDRSVKGFNLE